MSSTYLNTKLIKIPEEVMGSRIKIPYPEFFMRPSKSEIFGRFSLRNSGDETE